MENCSKLRPISKDVGKTILLWEILFLNLGKIIKSSFFSCDLIKVYSQLN